MRCDFPSAFWKLAFGNILEAGGNLSVQIQEEKSVRVSERTVCDPFLKHATVGYVVTWLRGYAVLLMVAVV